MSTVSLTAPLAEQVQRHQRWTDLERLRSSHRMMDAVIEEQRGRRIRIGDHWLADFASCNYLGFDLDEEIIDSVDGALRRWGTHPSWSRLLGNPRRRRKGRLRPATMQAAMHDNVDYQALR